MNEIITWAAQHNTIVIQVVFSIVLLLILIYVYRLFFVNSPTSTTESSVELNEVNQKLDQLLEQQKSSGIQVIEKVVTSAESAMAAVADTMAEASNPAELDQAKAENAKLKAQLNELEKKVFELTPIAGAEDSVKDEGPKVDPAQLTELNKKVEELQSRLSEYDIIADDIAELSQLRTENAELKKKIENGGGGSGGGSDGGGGSGGSEAEPVAAEPVVAPVIEAAPVAETAPEPVPEAIPDPVVVTADMAAILAEAEAEVAAAGETAQAAPAVEGGIPGFDAETAALLESLVNETDTMAAATEVVSEPVVAAPVESQTKLTMDQNIPDTEKNLINEFEKSIQKGS